MQFTYWRKDRRSGAGIPDGSGWAVTASWLFDDVFLPFVRIGNSDGGGGVAAEKAVSAGFGYVVRPDQTLALGVGWAEPVERDGDRRADEYVLELSYRFRLTENLELMPDVQLLFDPADNPDEDRVWVLGLRAKVTL